MIFIQSGSPCTTTVCCPYCIARSGTQYTTGIYTALDQTFTNLCFPTSGAMAVYWDFFGFCTNQLRIYADGTLIHDSYCVNTSGSTVVTIPAGTTSIRYLIEGGCSAPLPCTDQWSLTVLRWP